MARFLAAVGLVLLLACISATAQERFANSNGVRIHYVERGSGAPVVLVHGIGGSVNTWNQFGVFDNLSKSYRVIAFDARGHGLSGKPHKPSDYGRAMALDIVAVMEHLKVRKAHIIGYSMGGQLVAELLTLRPERFITATIGGAVPPFTSSEDIAERAEREASEIEKDGISRSMITRLAGTGPKPTEEEFARRKAEFFADPTKDDLPSPRLCARLCAL